MGHNLFVNRQCELRDLKLLQNKKTASLVVIYGRCRIGKSRLVEEFAHNETFYQFSGIIPGSDTTAQMQRDEFAQQFSTQLSVPHIQSEDWGDLFYLLAKEIKNKKVVILFDEISWMGSKDPEFLGKLKNAWDIYFKKNPKLILILCGSVSSWIDENILKSAAFMGRISLTILLKELALSHCHQLFKLIGLHASIYDEFKLLAITGGVPRYLEEVNPRLTTDENIKRLCFKKGGILVSEFEDIFHDLFSTKASGYKKIIRAMINGSLDYSEICKVINIDKGSYVTGLLNDLIKSGFIQRYLTWNFKTAKISVAGHYRISDNYLRFYLKYIEPNMNRIQLGSFDHYSLSLMAGWDSMMGYQFENLVLNSREYVQKLLDLKPEEIVFDNPIFQRKTYRGPGVQIDYLIHTRFNTLFVCEIKFSRNQVQSSVIAEVRKKIDNLLLPKGYSCFPVLIHVNGVCDQILDSGYFVKIIDFGELLNG